MSRGLAAECLIYSSNELYMHLLRVTFSRLALLAGRTRRCWSVTEREIHGKYKPCVVLLNLGGR